VKTTRCVVFPEVAAIDTVETTGTAPLPHPAIPPSAASASSIQSVLIDTRRLRLIIKAKPPSPSPASTSSLLGSALSGRNIADPLSANVTVLLTAAPAGVTVAGLKLHPTVAGSPEQVKLTADANPASGVTVSFAVVGLVFVAVPLAALIASRKSGVPAAAIVTITLFELEAENPVAPTYCAVSVCVPTARLEVVSVAPPWAFSGPPPIPELPS
jgi:hypothetical protein